MRCIHIKCIMGVKSVYSNITALIPGGFCIGLGYLINAGLVEDISVKPGAEALSGILLKYFAPFVLFEQGSRWHLLRKISKLMDADVRVLAST